MSLLVTRLPTAPRKTEVGAVKVCKSLQKDEVADSIKEQRFGCKELVETESCSLVGCKCNRQAGDGDLLISIGKRQFQKMALQVKT